VGLEMRFCKLTPSSASLQLIGEGAARLEEELEEPRIKLLLEREMQHHGQHRFMLACSLSVSSEGCRRQVVLCAPDGEGATESLLGAAFRRLITELPRLCEDSAMIARACSRSGPSLR